MRTPPCRAGTGLAAGIATVGLVAVLAAPGSTLGALAAAGSEVGHGETVLVSSGPPEPSEDPSGLTRSTRSPAVSGDGRTVAYTVTGPDPSGSSYLPVDRIQVRDLGAGTVTEIGRGLDQTAASLSADGTTLAYQASSVEATTPTSPGPGVDPQLVGEHEVYAADLSTAPPLVRRVTGGTDDVAFQRQKACLPWGEGHAPAVASCGPKLSADGTALAIPVRQSIVSSQLRMTAAVGAEEPPAPYLAWPHALGLVDFGADLTAIEVSLTAVGPDPIQIDDLQADPPFEVFPPEEGRWCEGVVLDPDHEVDDTCAVSVEFLRGDEGCGASTFGMLRVNSPVARGQTQVALVGQEGCEIIVSSAPSEPGAAQAIVDAGCGPTPQVPPTSSSAPDTGAAVVDHNLFDQPVGGSLVQTQLVVNQGSEPVSVGFEAGGCGIRLASPPEASGDEPPPCLVGMELESEASCVAHVRFAPTAVRPYAAVLTVGGRRFRFFGAGMWDVVVVKRDLTGEGWFGGPGRPAASIASRSGTGAVMSGVLPSISADGRQVAYVSDDGQVYVHDTDIAGDRSFEPGTTRLVSLVGPPGAESPAGWANEPSISGDGRRVAFTTIEVDAEGREESEVHVRDLTLGRTVAVSTPPTPGPEYRPLSHSPVLTGDGSTVAFASRSLHLLPDGVDATIDQVFVRDLGPDFGGPGSPSTEIVSLPVAADGKPGHAGMPAVDRTGAAVVFGSSGDLTGVDPPFDFAVYARHRFGQPVVEPTVLAFPAQQVGTVSPPRSVSVRNDGPGPASVQVAVTGPFRVADRCVGVVLHRGESCVFDLVFAPTEVGEETGQARVTTSNPVWTGSTDLVPLFGVAVAPNVPPDEDVEPAQLRLEPATLEFGDQVVGVPSDPRVVTATNAGKLPISVVAALGEGTGDFLVAPAAPAGCADLAPGESCQIPVSFAPSVLGERTGRLDVTATLQGIAYPHQVPAAGTAVAPVLGLAPALLEYDAQVVGVASDPVVVTATNLTDVPMSLAAVVGEGGDDFLLDPEVPGGCLSLGAGESCGIPVRFLPSLLGERAGRVDITATVGGLDYPHPVPAAGLAADPVLEFSPVVVREGQVTHLSGENFLPGVPVELEWSGGLSAVPVIIPEADGTFETPVVVLRGAGLGPRTLKVTMPGIGEVESEPLLVVGGQAQPPDFAARN